jgi:hypothetical protein
MQTKTLLAAAALVASAFADGENMKWQTSKAATTSQHHTWPAHNGTITTTKVVSKYTTWCPEPTTVCIGTKTYTVTKPTTLTITDCPCTITEVRVFFVFFLLAGALQLLLALLLTFYINRLTGPTSQRWFLLLLLPPSRPPRLLTLPPRRLLLLLQVPRVVPWSTASPWLLPVLLALSPCKTGRKLAWLAYLLPCSFLEGVVFF